MDTPSTDAEVTYRRADEADLPRLFPVFRAAVNAYLGPAGRPLVPDEDEQQLAFEHLFRHDAERLWVAERAGGEAVHEIVGWTCGLLRGHWWFLADLFVLPGAQGKGVGAQLFDLAQTGARAAAVRATVTDSIQPISNALYARRGLLPREVLVNLGGRPRPDFRVPRMGTLEWERLTTATVPELREIDEAAGGVDRSVDHEFYLTSDHRYGWLFRRAGRPVAYAMVRQDGCVGPIASIRRRDMETVTRYAIGDLVWRGVIEKVRAGVTGACEGAQRAFWDAGLVFESTPGLLLASRPFGRLDRYLATSYGMF